MQTEPISKITNEQKDWALDLHLNENSIRQTSFLQEEHLSKARIF